MKIDLLGPPPKMHAVFSVHEGKPYGVPDEYRIDVVHLHDDGQLSPGIRESVYNCSGEWMCWLPRGWVGYYLCSYQERSMGPNEEDAEGPYLFPDAAPPTQEELRAAAIANTLVIRAPQGC